MDVVYHTTAQDYVEFCRHSHRTSPWGRTLLVSKWMTFPIIVALLLFLWYHSALGSLLGIKVLALALLTCPFLHGAMQSYAAKSQLKEDGGRGIVGEIRLILTDDMLTEVTEVTTSAARWTDIHRIDSVRGYTFIYVTPMAAAILPCRGFPSPELYEQTVEFARTCWERARSCHSMECS